MNAEQQRPMIDRRRRDVLASGAAAGLLACAPRLALAEELGAKVDDLHLGTFRFDVTPPRGASLCGGWIRPVEAVDDPLEAIGFVLLGAGDPIVICAVDWTGICNDTHVTWRHQLAEAVGTSPERVAVQCVHQHNAPFACLAAEKLVAAQGDLPHVIELDFHRRIIAAAQRAVVDASKQA